MNYRSIAGCVLAAGLATTWASAADATASAIGDASDQWVTREEFARQQRELEALRAQVQQSQRAAPPADGTAPAAGSPGLEGLQEEVDALKARVDRGELGQTRFVFTGYAAAGFTDQEHEDKAFSAAFNPTMLWKLDDRLLFEGQLEIELEGVDTTTGLEFAQMTYLLNDFVTVGVGKFLSPMNSFVERFNPSWVNRLPDKPLAVYDGFLPETNVGAELRGGAPIGPTKVDYAFYAANAPSLTTDDPAAAGTLEFDNFDNANGNVALGGRVGFLPIPQLELGYGAQFSGVGAKDTAFHAVDSFLQSVDLNFVHDSAALAGVIDVRAQWAWSHVDRTTYDPDGSLGFGPLTFSNRRYGGYAQASYRPSRVRNRLLDRIEVVVRYDRIWEDARAPGASDEQRETVGLDYWLNASTALKVAYEIDQRYRGDLDENAFLVQAAMGF